MKRLFFGLSLGEADKTALAQWREQALPAIRKPVPVANFHLTLAFVGGLSPAAMAGALALAAALPFAPFDLVLDSFGQWPRSGIAFLAPSQPPEALMALAAELQAISNNVGGFADHRRYQPHLTLARGAHRPMEPLLPPPALHLRAEHFALFESAAGRYQEIASLPQAQKKEG
ncbi:RNA 2',3'-cyclic phosphodiesterase [Gallaecimonas kandeliae]|uniref:RNA 2',3'-cyclic phosphodiesterase n=1 Tax=Gallaecimonas kandeliae TaxID=3029055 RepID=UPI00264972DE|nr:RNA 2',3'-cyclic phosphodiesterase [Gallaecimonas kandeliae]WKE66313.1 RNA 2',3'-cyclic phosphodiesterase [Gallaecimonas kandeliae]